jgi:hypothetical protein
MLLASTAHVQIEGMAHSRVLPMVFLQFLHIIDGLGNICSPNTGSGDIAPVRLLPLLGDICSPNTGSGDIAPVRLLRLPVDCLLLRDCIPSSNTTCADSAFVPISNSVYVAQASLQSSHLLLPHLRTTIMTSPQPTTDPSNAHTYSASCHCGLVQYSVLLSPPLPHCKVVSCNCSICTRNGYLLVYPERSQLHMKSGEEVLTTYTFGVKRNLHRFCAKCGSAVWFDPRMGAFGDAPPDLLGVNVGF